MEPSPHAIEVIVATRFLDDQSIPEDDRYVFAYTIRIRNAGTAPAQLLARHWVITDANGKVQEVRDDGTEFDAPIASFTLSIPRTLH